MLLLYVSSLIAVVIAIAGIRVIILLRLIIIFIIFVTVTIAVIFIFKKFQLRSQFGLCNNPKPQCLVLACPCLAFQSSSVGKDDKKQLYHHI